MNFGLFTETLPIIGQAYGGVFAVTVAIVLIIKLLSFVIDKK